MIQKRSLGSLMPSFRRALALSFGLALAAGCGDDGMEAPSNCLSLLEPLVGSYLVVNEVVHDRGTIVVREDGGIDFDENTSFEPGDIEACYDRLSQEHSRRVQISYGFDDDGPVINLYLPSGHSAESVRFIEYRHRDIGVEVRAAVQVSF